MAPHAFVNSWIGATNSFFITSRFLFWWFTLEGISFLSFSSKASTTLKLLFRTLISVFLGLNFNFFHAVRLIRNSAEDPSLYIDIKSSVPDVDWCLDCLSGHCSCSSFSSDTFSLYTKLQNTSLIAIAKQDVSFLPKDIATDLSSWLTDATHNSRTERVTVHGRHC